MNSRSTRSLRTVRVRGLEFNVVDSGGPATTGSRSCGATRSRRRSPPRTATACSTGPTVRGERRWIRYDARGHGTSRPRRHAADYRWPNLAHDQLELMDTLEIDRVVLGGASMGAATALHSACFQPDRVGALVLVIPPAAWDTRHESSKKYRSSARYTMTHGVHGLAKATRKQPEPADLRRPPRAALQGGGIGAIDDLHYLSAVAALRGAAGSDLPTPTQLGPHPRHPDADPGVGHRPGPPGEHRRAPGRRLRPRRPPRRHRPPRTVAHWPDEVAHFLADCE